MMKSLLIANRGEIACRIIHTAKKLGIRAIAVYSDADRMARHVRLADDAVHIGPSAVRESYLAADKLVAAAQSSGAEAIHPGYGFLSENADFADTVLAANLLWVGPTPSSIRAMGLKDAAKKLMAAAGVPVTPGFFGEDQSIDHLQHMAEKIGYPVLIKAVAGGGGKGMRKVVSSVEFVSALESCQREALSSFGDARVLIEKYIQRPRHIEVQVFGDIFGNIVHLFERDCSLQRRHQKIIEEAPAPGMDEATRAIICEAATQAARAVAYVGAGTIEFIADVSNGLRGDRIWFMEMNTRLQVEHPVTEAITGQDLVEWQLRIASGERLPRLQHELHIHGHAIEARLYAEDPSSGFLPSIGRLDRFTLPTQEVRIDTGVEQGDEISPFYDPMIAKIIVRDGTRWNAAAKLAKVIGAAKIWPVKTNAAFLTRTLDNSDFIVGDIHTDFIDQHRDQLIPASYPTSETLRAAAWAMVKAGGRYASGGSVWRSAVGFRINDTISQRAIDLSCDGQTYTVELGREPPRHPGLTIERFGYGLLVSVGGQSFFITLARVDVGLNDQARDGAIRSPMPGFVLSVAVTEGESVVKGQHLLILEAMKMEHVLAAPFDGIVSELKVIAHSQVIEGAILINIAPAEEGRA